MGGLSWGEVHSTLAVVGGISGGLFQSFIVVFQIAIFNVITSIYVDKARQLGQPDESDALADKLLQEKEEKEELRTLIARLDTDRSGLISYQELEESLQHPEVVQHFEYYGLLIRDVKLFFKALGPTGQKRDVLIETGFFFLLRWSACGEAQSCWEYVQS